jgi:hypothetical protein
MLSLRSDFAMSAVICLAFAGSCFSHLGQPLRDFPDRIARTIAVAGHDSANTSAAASASAYPPPPLEIEWP